MSNADIVVFVVSLSEFDEVCYEDGSTNRLMEGLKVFEEYVDVKYISERPCFIIFNKMDVLEEKIKRGVKFSHYFPEFIGNDSNVKEVSQFIVQSYLKLDIHSRIIKIFKTCALNPQHVKSCFETIVSNAILGEQDEGR